MNGDSMRFSAVKKPPEEAAFFKLNADFHARFDLSAKYREIFISNTEIIFAVYFNFESSISY